MAEPAPERGRWPRLAHQILEHLTVVKVHIGLLRHRLRRGELEPAEVEAHLDRIEQEVDVTASVAKTVRAEEGGTA